MTKKEIEEKPNEEIEARCKEAEEPKEEKPEEKAIDDDYEEYEDDQGKIHKLRRKKKEAKKDAAGGINPEEGVAKPTDTTSPGAGTPSPPQHIIVPSSIVDGARIATGTTPGQESYSGKQFHPEFYKSPVGLCVKALELRIAELEKKLEEQSQALVKRLVQKESNSNATMDNVAPEGMTEKLAKGYVEPTDKFSY